MTPQQTANGRPSIRYSFGFLLIGLLVAVWSFRVTERHLWSLLLLYPSATFILLGMAYAGGGPALLGKRPDGRRSWFGIVWTAPYSVLNELAWRLATFTSRQPAIGQAANNLFFGRRLTERDRVAITAHQFQSCLDLTAEFTETPSLRRLPNYRCLPILDGTAPSIDQLHDVVRWLNAATSTGPVYVHCALGHRRTGTVVIAFLLANRIEYDVVAALNRLRQSRPGVVLNAGNDIFN